MPKTCLPFLVLSSSLRLPRLEWVTLEMPATSRKTWPRTHSPQRRGLAYLQTRRNVIILIRTWHSLSSFFIFCNKPFISLVNIRSYLDKNRAEWLLHEGSKVGLSCWACWSGPGGGDCPCGVDWQGRPSWRTARCPVCFICFNFMFSRRLQILTVSMGVGENHGKTTILLISTSIHLTSMTLRNEFVW